MFTRRLLSTSIPLLGPALAAALALVITLVTTQPTRANSRIIYVDADAPGQPHDGSSWRKAYRNVQPALSAAVLGDEIWVAEGVYLPTLPTDPDDPRSLTFQLVSGVALYGGFAGTETGRQQRDWVAHPAILSGDIGKVGDTSDNSYHVVTANGVDLSTVLDGFTITAGNAYGPGGGMYNENSNLTLTNVTFSGNSALEGGGMANWVSSPSLTNVTFSSNSASYDGGGMFNLDSSPTLTGVIFSGNSAEFGGGIDNSSGSPILFNVTFSGNSAEFGGGMDIENGSPTLTDVTFSDNHASNSGGGIYNGYSSPTLTYVSFSGNSAEHGGGMYNVSSSSPALTNVIFSGNSATYEGGGMYNLDGSNPTLTNVAFSDNSAGEGGGMYNWESLPTLTNVTFSGNLAKSGGGGMFNTGESSPTLINVTFNGNSAYGAYSVMYNSNSNPTLSNCILWGNMGLQIYNGENSVATITYSDVQGGYPGAGNIDLDPLFVDALIGDLRLGLSSPAIDAGDNSAVPLDTLDLDGDGDTAEPIPYDLAGRPRFVDIDTLPDTGVGPPPIVDMGAYEAANTLYLSLILWH